MFRIDIRDTIKQFQQKIDRVQNQAQPKVVELALNWTATDVQIDLTAEMLEVFDRPTPFTLNSLFTQPALPGRLESHVYFKDFAPKGTAAGVYLAPEIEGGGRDLKRFEQALRGRGLLPSGMYAMPGAKAEIDAYGNMSRGQIVKILSALGAQRTGGYTSARNGRGRGVRRNEEYFVPKPGRGLAPGVYQRLSGHRVAPVLIFTRAPAYRARFDFTGVGQRSALAWMPRNYQRAWDYAATKGLLR